MKKHIMRTFVCAILILLTIFLTACSDETEDLQARINALESENATLQSTISSLNADLARSQTDLSRAQNEMQDLLDEMEAAEEEQQRAASGLSSGPLAITFYRNPSTDRSWPLRDGVLDDVVGLNVDWNEFDEDTEIVWISTNEDIFTVAQSEDGLSAKVTPVAVGAAELVVTVGDKETRSWLRIT